jgi:hypothetical protein
MKKLTLAIDEETLEASREYARKRRLTVNALIRQLLIKTVRRGSRAKLKGLFELMDAHAGRASKGYKFRREDAYGV